MSSLNPTQQADLELFESMLRMIHRNVYATEEFDTKDCLLCYRDTASTWVISEARGQMMRLAIHDLLYLFFPDYDKWTGWVMEGIQQFESIRRGREPGWFDLDTNQLLEVVRQKLQE